MHGWIGLPLIDLSGLGRLFTVIDLGVYKGLEIILTTVVSIFRSNLRMPSPNLPSESPGQP